MLAKAIAIFTFIATVNGALIADPRTGSLGAHAEQTVRGFGGLSSVSQYSKAVDSPFTSVRKTDTRVTNDAFGTYAAPIAHHAYAAPALHHGYAAPALAGYAGAPLAHHAYAAPAYAGPAYAGPAYAGPAYAGPAYAGPAVAAHPAYAAPYAAAPIAHHPYAAGPVAHHGYAAPALAHHAYAAPIAHHAYAAPAALAHHKVVGGPALGVTYSAVSPAVATLNFNGYGISYGY